jgi:mannose-6-phosphate isomerase
VLQGILRRLPFLFKVIAAEKPLSIQVHPNVERAKKGFARENALGIPLDAPHRNYRDDNHKPELLCALTPFLALKGFREIREMVDLIGRVCPSSLSELYERFKERGNRDGLKDFFSALLSTEERHRRSLVSEAVDLAQGLAGKDLAFHWMMELNRQFPLDVGVLSPLILNLVELKPGEAIFLPDGELHAYLSGMGLEIMANSDNVLRGGLTPKHIDVPELLRNLAFRLGPAPILVPLLEGRGEERYSTPAKEFELSKISIAGRAPFVSRKNRSVEVLLCGEGEGTLTDVVSGRTTSIRAGQSALVPGRSCG